MGSVWHLRIYKLRAIAKEFKSKWRARIRRKLYLNDINFITFIHYTNHIKIVKIKIFALQTRL